MKLSTNYALTNNVYKQMTGLKFLLLHNNTENYLIFCK